MTRLLYWWHIYLNANILHPFCLETGHSPMMDPSNLDLDLETWEEMWGCIDIGNVFIGAPFLHPNGTLRAHLICQFGGRD